MVITAPRKIILKGTPREIGLSHGRLLRHEIKSQIAVYDAMFLVTSNLSWPAVLSTAEEFRATVELRTPDIYDEMVGIADGADVSVLDIVALNSRSEIALGRFSDGCTSLSWKAEGRTVLAQNWDWTAQVKGNLVMMSIEKVGKPRIHMITEAGIVGKIGFNSEAVGTCLNAIRAKPALTSKLPVHVALRLCLESASVEEAVAKLTSLGGVASSQHILLADSGGGVGMEVSPLGNIYLMEDEHGIVTHTNHFIENRLVDESPWLSGSPIRLERVRALLAELRSQGVTGDLITGDILRGKLFGDSFNSPQAICCQEDPSRPLETRSSTLFNIVMDLKKGEPCAEVVWGMPGSSAEGDVLLMPWK